jgi:hypothetical protein
MRRHSGNCVSLRTGSLTHGGAVYLQSGAIAPPPAKTVPHAAPDGSPVGCFRETKTVKNTFLAVVCFLFGGLLFFVEVAMVVERPSHAELIGRAIYWLVWATLASCTIVLLRKGAHYLRKAE